MEVAEAALAVLADAPDEDLHWTVVWNRALTKGYLDAFTQAGQRDAFLRALGDLARTGRIEKTSKGTYRVAGTPPAGGR